MKKIIVSIIMVLCCITLCGCSLSKITVLNNILRTFHVGTKTEDSAVLHQKQIAEDFVKGNKDAVKEMFSQYALSQAEDFDNNLDYLFEIMQAGELEIVSIDDTPVETYSQTPEKEEKWISYMASMEVAVDDTRYEIQIYEYLEDKKNPDNIGIRQIVVYWPDAGGFQGNDMGILFSKGPQV